MKKKQFLFSMLLILGLSGTASATTIDGVTWDPDSFLDFSSFSLAIHQDIDSASGVASGYGIISTMNGTDASVFIPGGELTFQYGDFTPFGGTVLPGGVGDVISYQNGFVNLFADNSIDITNPADPTTLTFANTGDGANFLQLLGHNNSATGESLTGTVISGSGGIGLSGIGSLDVVGGDAAWYLIQIRWVMAPT